MHWSFEIEARSFFRTDSVVTKRYDAANEEGTTGSAAPTGEAEESRPGCRGEPVREIGVIGHFKEERVLVPAGGTISVTDLRDSDGIAALGESAPGHDSPPMRNQSVNWPKRTV